MTPMERYHTDANFHAIVRMMLDLFENSCGTGAGFTPSEIREASGLALQIYTERHPHPMIVRPEPVA